MMGYSNQFAMAVRVNGQFVTEKANGELHLPFGSSYSLRFKNKHNRYAKVDVKIDGESIGAWEVPPCGSIDIHRPAHKDAAFTFASLDSEAALFAGKSGDNPNNVKGLIEATFYLEVSQPVVTVTNWPSTPWITPRPSPIPKGPYYGMSSQNIGATTLDWQAETRSISYSADVNCSSLASTPVADGCTVDGGMTGQQFGVSYRTFETAGTTIKVFLRGFLAGAVPVYPSLSGLPMTAVQQENIRLKMEIDRRKAEKQNEAARLAEEQENRRLKEELAAIS